MGGNVALPMQVLTGLDAAAIRRFTRLKLGLVGMADAIGLAPSEISGGGSGYAVLIARRHDLSPTS